MQREYSCMLVVAVYLPPSANTNQVLDKQYKAVNKLQRAHQKHFSLLLGTSIMPI